MGEYVRLTLKTGRQVFIPLYVGKWGAPFRELFQEACSGADVFAAYSANNFGRDGPNPFHEADIKRYKARRGAWTEFFKDKVIGRGLKAGEIVPKGYRPALYIANADTDREEEIDVLVPPSGRWVPTEEGIFYPGTVVPFATVYVDNFDDVKIAEQTLERHGVPKEELSEFYRDIGTGIEVCPSRIFDPDLISNGRFCIALDKRLLWSGREDVGCRYRTEKPVVMEIDLRKQPQMTESR